MFNIKTIRGLAIVNRISALVSGRTSKEDVAMQNHERELSDMPTPPMEGNIDDGTSIPFLAKVLSLSLVGCMLAIGCAENGQVCGNQDLDGTTDGVLTDDEGIHGWDPNPIQFDAGLIFLDEMSAAGLKPELLFIYEQIDHPECSPGMAGVCADPDYNVRVIMRFHKPDMMPAVHLRFIEENETIHDENVTWVSASLCQTNEGNECGENKEGTTAVYYDEHASNERLSIHMKLHGFAAASTVDYEQPAATPMVDEDGEPMETCPDPNIEFDFGIGQYSKNSVSGVATVWFTDDELAELVTEDGTQMNPTRHDLEEIQVITVEPGETQYITEEFVSSPNMESFMREHTGETSAERRPIWGDVDFPVPTPTAVTTVR